MTLQLHLSCLRSIVVGPGHKVPGCARTRCGRVQVLNSVDFCGASPASQPTLGSYRITSSSPTFTCASTSWSSFWISTDKQRCQVLQQQLGPAVCNPTVLRPAGRQACARGEPSSAELVLSVGSLLGRLDVLTSGWCLWFQGLPY